MKTTLFGKRSFKYAAPVLWNSLPDDLDNVPILISLRGLFFHGMEKKCNCVACNSN